jgi:hypothetical protein
VAWRRLREFRVGEGEACSIEPGVSIFFIRLKVTALRPLIPSVDE